MKVVPWAEGCNDRAVSSIVAVAILLGMVLSLVVIAAIAGGALIDSLQDRAEAEQVENEFTASADQIRQAILTNNPRQLPNTQAQPVVESDTTTFTFQRVDGDGGIGSVGWRGNSESISLNSLKFADESQVLVFEGGGQWKISQGGQTLVDNPPDVGVQYDEQTGVQINMVDVSDQSSFGTGQSVVDPQPNQQVTTDDIEDVFADYATEPEGDDLLISVESQHIDAWEQYFTSGASVSVDSENVGYASPTSAETADDELLLLFEDIGEAAEFTITDVDAPELITKGDSPTFDVGVENTGSVPGESLLNLSINPERSTTIDLDSGETVNETFTIPSGQLGLGSGVATTNLSQYGEQEYVAETATARVNGTMLYSYSGAPAYRVEEHTFDPDELAFDLELLNVGETAGERDITLELIPDDSNRDPLTFPGQSDVWTVDTEPWDGTTAELAINETTLPNGEYDYEITIHNTDKGLNYDNDKFPSAALDEVVTGSFVRTDGEDFEPDTDRVEIQGDGEVNASILAAEVSSTNKQQECVDWGWLGCSEWETYFERSTGATTASAIFQYIDDSGGEETVVANDRIRFSTDGNHDEVPFDSPFENLDGSNDLNRFEHRGAEIDEQTKWTITENVSERRADIAEDDPNLDGDDITVSVSIETTQHNLASSPTFEGSDAVDQITIDGESYTDVRFDHYHRQPWAIGQSTVLASAQAQFGAGDDPIDGVDEGFLRVRSPESNTLPEISPPSDQRQYGVREVFEEVADISVTNRPGGGLELDLDDNQFAFMAEVTMQEGVGEYRDMTEAIAAGRPEIDDADEFSELDRTTQTELAWWRAQTRDPGLSSDPNFNDVIGLIEAPPTQAVEVTVDTEVGFATSDTEGISTTQDTSTFGGGDSEIDVGVDEIRIS